MPVRCRCLARQPCLFMDKNMYSVLKCSCRNIYGQQWMLRLHPFWTNRGRQGEIYFTASLKSVPLADERVHLLWLNNNEWRDLRWMERWWRRVRGLRKVILLVQVIRIFISTCLQESISQVHFFSFFFFVWWRVFWRCLISNHLWTLMNTTDWIAALEWRYSWHIAMCIPSSRHILESIYTFKIPWRFQLIYCFMLGV